MTAAQLQKALAGYSVSDAAKVLGISRRMLTYYLAGKWPIPKLVELAVSSLRPRR